MHPVFRHLGIREQRIVDEIASRFEQELRDGKRPTIEDYLGTHSDDLSPYLLRELLGVELSLKNSAGETPDVNEYLKRFPDYQTLVEQVFSHETELESRVHERRNSRQTMRFANLSAGVEGSDVGASGSEPPTVDEVLRRIQSTGLISSSEVSDYAPRARQQFQDGEEFLEHLVARQRMTPYQAKLICLSTQPKLRFGRYVVHDLIGKGGMGAVLKARHIQMQRTVALKVLSSAGSLEAIKRFRREIQSAAQLSHPNVVRAYDAGEANGEPYLVMEYVEGKDLHAVVRENGPLNWQRAINYVTQAAKGLRSAHQRQLVHRDVKPSNILIDCQGTVRILDLGLALLRTANDEANSDLTQTGVVLGTLHFMAPEQAINPRNADARSDIYSLGITLYFLLTGRVPFDGKTAAEVLVAHREQSIPSLSQVANAPPDLDSILNRMVAKSPDSRYSTLSGFLEDINKLSAIQDTVTAVPVQQTNGVSEQAILLNSMASQANTEQTTADASRLPVLLLTAIPVLLAVVVIGLVLAFKQTGIPLFMPAINATDQLDTNELATNDGAEGVRDVDRNHAVSIVSRLADSNLSEVEGIVDELTGIEEGIVRPVLESSYLNAPIDSAQRLNTAIALTRYDPGKWEYLHERLLHCDRSELPFFVKLMSSGQPDLENRLWNEALSNDLEPSCLLRIGASLCILDANSNNWGKLSKSLASSLVTSSDPNWLLDFHPVRKTLIEQLTPFATSGTKSARKALKILLSYSPNRVDLLVPFLSFADDAQRRQLLAEFADQKGIALPLLASEFKERLTNRKSEIAVAAITRMLYDLNEMSFIWEPFLTESSAELRSYLATDWRQIGLLPSQLVRAITSSDTPSEVRPMIWQMLATASKSMSPEERKSLRDEARIAFANASGAAEHSSIEWLLMALNDAGWLAEAKAKLVRPEPLRGMNWYVDPIGLTFIVVKIPESDGNGAYRLAVSSTEIPAQIYKAFRQKYPVLKQEVDGDVPTPIAAMLQEFERAVGSKRLDDQASVPEDTPQVFVNWFEAIAFCRWASEERSIGENQMCIPSIKSFSPAPRMGYQSQQVVFNFGPGGGSKRVPPKATTFNQNQHVVLRLPTNVNKRLGYRLPTIGEWAALRAQSSVIENSPSILRSYERFAVNSNGRPHEIGTTRPDLSGMFDLRGNVSEWCFDLRNQSANARKHDVTYGVTTAIAGGSFNTLSFNQPVDVRAIQSRRDIGFRIVRRLND